MSVAVNTLARTTVVDAVGDTSSSASSLKPAAVDNAAIEALLRRGRRWRMPASIVDDTPPLLIAPKAPATSGIPRARSRWPLAAGFFVSLSVHLVLLVAAALVAIHVGSPPAPLIVVECGMLESEPIETVTLEAPPVLATSQAGAEDDVVPLAAIDLDPGVVQHGSPQLVLAECEESSVARVLADVAGLPEGVGDGRSTEGEGQGGGGGADGAEFFGVQASGRRFVFVCDCSRSMAGLKWAELHQELSRCLGGLGPGKSFYVIFFDGKMHPMFEPFGREPQLLDATDENIEKARYWIANAALGLNTSPCDSMKFAASLEPDAIFLLTDGEFSDYTAPYLRDFNKQRAAQGKSKVAVHTIGLFSQKHQLVLERIAKDSGGTYKFIGGADSRMAKRKSQNVIARPVSAPVFGGTVPFGAVPSGGD